MKTDKLSKKILEKYQEGVMGWRDVGEKRKMMKSIIIKAMSSLHLEQSREFISARLLNLLFTPESHKCATLEEAHG